MQLLQRFASCEMPLRVQVTMARRTDGEAFEELGGLIADASFRPEEHAGVLRDLRTLREAEATLFAAPARSRSPRSGKTPRGAPETTVPPLPASGPDLSRPLTMPDLRDRNQVDLETVERPGYSVQNPVRNGTRGYCDIAARETIALQTEAEWLQVPPFDMKWTEASMQGRQLRLKLCIFNADIKKILQDTDSWAQQECAARSIGLLGEKMSAEQVRAGVYRSPLYEHPTQMYAPTVEITIALKGPAATEVSSDMDGKSGHEVLCALKDALADRQARDKLRFRVHVRPVSLYAYASRSPPPQRCGLNLAAAMLEVRGFTE